MFHKIYQYFKNEFIQDVLTICHFTLIGTVIIIMCAIILSVIQQVVNFNEPISFIWVAVTAIAIISTIITIELKIHKVNAIYIDGVSFDDLQKQEIRKLAQAEFRRLKELEKQGIIDISIFDKV